MGLIRICYRCNDMVMLDRDTLNSLCIRVRYLHTYHLCIGIDIMNIHYRMDSEDGISRLHINEGVLHMLVQMCICLMNIDMYHQDNDIALVYMRVISGIVIYLQHMYHHNNYKAYLHYKHFQL